jgi:hypothetical protein
MERVIQLPYIERTLINVTMHPQYTNNKKLKVLMSHKSNQVHWFCVSLVNLLLLKSCQA